MQTDDNRFYLFNTKLHTFVDITPYPAWYSGQDIHSSSSSYDGKNYFDEERHVLSG